MVKTLIIKPIELSSDYEAKVAGILRSVIENYYSTVPSGK